MRVNEYQPDGPRIVIFGPSNLGPYHLARYNALARKGVELMVVRSSFREYPRPWSPDLDSAEFSVEMFNNSGRAWKILGFGRARGLIAQFAPSATVLIGYSSSSVWSFAAASRALRVPNVLTLIAAPNPRNQKISKEIAKRLICRVLFDVAVTPGVRGARYARSLGFPEEAIFKVGNVVDNKHFLRPATRDQSCGRFVFIGRLAPEKNLERLLMGYKLYREAGGRWELLIVGDGPWRDRLDGIVQGTKGASIRSWASYEEVPKILHGSSALVLPSTHEPWGLVVNEAMAAGLPVLVSKDCGCYPELCEEGVNSFGFDPESSSQICESMYRTSSLSESQLELMGLNSMKIIDDFTIDSWVDKLLTCVRSIN